MPFNSKCSNAYNEAFATSESVEDIDRKTNLMQTAPNDPVGSSIGIGP